MRTTRALLLPEVLAATAVLGAVSLLAAPALQARKTTADPATEDLSRVKQIATGLLIYESDSDDVAPDAFAEARSEGGAALRSATALFPAPNAENPTPLVAASWTHWSNAMWPYVKNAEVYASASAPELPFPDPGAYPGWRPKPTVFAMNGLLGHLPAAEIANPSTLPLFTESLGNANVVGLAASNPELNCRAAEPCRFAPPKDGRCAEGANGATSRLASSGRDARFTAGKGAAKNGYQVLAHADGSAKRIALPSPGAPSDPGVWWWSRLDANGAPTRYWRDPEACHPARFRPDGDPGAGVAEANL